MLRILSSYLANFFILSCFFSAALLLLSIGMLFLFLPRLLPVLRKLLWAFFYISYRLYSWILEKLDPLARRVFGADFFIGLPRIAACLLLSLAFGYVIRILTNMPLSQWLFLIHGLIVGLTWEAITFPKSFHMGAKIQ